MNAAPVWEVSFLIGQALPVVAMFGERWCQTQPSTRWRRNCFFVFYQAPVFCCSCVFDCAHVDVSRGLQTVFCAANLCCQTPCGLKCGTKYELGKTTKGPPSRRITLRDEIERSATGNQESRAKGEQCFTTQRVPPTSPAANHSRCAPCHLPRRPFKQSLKKPREKLSRRKAQRWKPDELKTFQVSALFLFKIFFL